MESYDICFFVWLFSVSIIFSRFTHIVAVLIFDSFYGWILFHYMYIPHFVYPFISWWTFGLFPFFLAIMNNAIIYIHVLIQEFVWTCFNFSLVFILLKNRVARSYGNSMFNYSKTCQTAFSSSCPITFLPAQYECSDLFIFSPTHAIIWLFDFSHPRGCKVIFHWGFDLHCFGSSDIDHLFIRWLSLIHHLLNLLQIY